MLFTEILQIAVRECAKLIAIPYTTGMEKLNDICINLFVYSGTVR